MEIVGQPVGTGDQQGIGEGCRSVCQGSAAQLQAKSNVQLINPAINIVGLITRHKDVPPLAEGQREPVKRKQIRAFTPAFRE